MVTLKLFGMNGGSIGKFQPLQKVERLTVTLSNATVSNTVASNPTDGGWAMCRPAHPPRGG